jgi:hypothetical protein
MFADIRYVKFVIVGYMSEYEIFDVESAAAVLLCRFVILSF